MLNTVINIKTIMTKYKVQIEYNEEWGKYPWVATLKSGRTQDCITTQGKSFEECLRELMLILPEYFETVSGKRFTKNSFYRFQRVIYTPLKKDFAKTS
jgi:hypothetical protein